MFLMVRGRFFSFLQPDKCRVLSSDRRSIDAGISSIAVSSSVIFLTFSERNGKSSRLEHPSRCRVLRSLKLMLFGRFLSFLQPLSSSTPRLFRCLTESVRSTRLSQLSKFNFSRLVAFDRLGTSSSRLHPLKFIRLKFPRSWTYKEATAQATKELADYKLAHNIEHKHKLVPEFHSKVFQPNC